MVSALSSAVRTRRRQLGLTQTDIAELAGVSRRFVSALENEKPSVQLSEVLAVLEVLGLGLVVTAGRGDIREDRTDG